MRKSNPKAIIHRTIAAITHLPRKHDAKVPSRALPTKAHTTLECSTCQHNISLDTDPDMLRDSIILRLLLDLTNFMQSKASQAVYCRIPAPPHHKLYVNACNTASAAQFFEAIGPCIRHDHPSHGPRPTTLPSRASGSGRRRLPSMRIDTDKKPDKMKG